MFAIQKQGQNQLSFASRLLEEEGMRDDVFDQYVKETMVSMSAGGVDTVRSSDATDCVQVRCCSHA